MYGITLGGEGFIASLLGTGAWGKPSSSGETHAVQYRAYAELIV
jgi:hypothetical protein